MILFNVHRITLVIMRIGGGENQLEGQLTGIRFLCIYRFRMIFIWQGLRSSRSTERFHFCSFKWSNSWWIPSPPPNDVHLIQFTAVLYDPWRPEFEKRQLWDGRGTQIFPWKPPQRLSPVAVGSFHWIAMEWGASTRRLNRPIFSLIYTRVCRGWIDGCQIAVKFSSYSVPVLILAKCLYSP